MEIWGWILHFYDSRGLTYQRYSETEPLNAPPRLFLPKLELKFKSTFVLLDVRGDIGRRLVLGSEERCHMSC